MSLLQRRRRAREPGAGGCAHALCVDCQVETHPWEIYAVTDELWAAAGAPDGFLCIGCLEERLGRPLEAADFPPVPLNDDEEVDSIRLRQCKGSGRNAEAAYRLGVDAVIGLGVDTAAAAEQLGIDPAFLATRVDHARTNLQFLAEIAAEDEARR